MNHQGGGEAAMGDTRTVRNTVTMFCILLATIGGARSEEHVDSIIKENDSREQYMKSYRLVWEVTETRITNPRVPTEVQQELEVLQKDLTSRASSNLGKRVVQEELRQWAYAEIAGRREVYKTMWEFEWGKDFLRVSGALPYVSPSGTYQGTAYLRWYLGEGWGIDVIYAESFVDKALQGLMGSPPVVWCCTAGCYRYDNPTGRVILPPEELALAACLNPLRVREAKSWKVVRADGYQTVLTTAGIEITLSNRYDWLPLRIVSDYSTYMVTRFRKLGTHWIPERLEVRGHIPGVTRWERVWVLRQVSPRRPISLDEISQAISLKRWEVVDWRLHRCNMTLGERLEANERQTGVVVSYRWNGRLPTLEELAAIRSRQLQSQTRAQGGIGGSAWFRLAPPILLIAGGLLWYWRVKRKPS